MKKIKIKNYQKIWPRKSLKVDDIWLDTKNIRLDDNLTTQQEVINDLFVNEKAFEIVISIIENGFFPDEPPVVIKENNKYVVIDGNRRVVALKAIQKPRIVPAQFTKKIINLTSNIIPLTTIDVHIARSREDAEKYLSAKHTKNTRRQWSALRRAYFYYAQKDRGIPLEKIIEKYKGVDIPKYIRMYEMHHIALSLENITDSTRASIENKRQFNISTLERLYNDEYARDWMGVEFKETGEVVVPKTKAFDLVYSRIITDIVTGRADSRTHLKTKATRKAYIESVITDVLSGKKIERSNLSKASSFKPKTIRRPKSKKLINKNIENTFDSYGIDEVLRELKSINYIIYPNATADLLRTFLEIVLRKYLEMMGESPSPGRNGFVAFQLIINKAVSVIANDNTEVAQLLKYLKDEKKIYLDAINHNPSFYADYIFVEEMWRRMEDIIKYIFNKFK